MKSRVTVINKDNFSVMYQLPSDNLYYVISLTFLPSDRPKLAISYSNHSIVIFDCEDGTYSELSKLFSGNRFQKLITSEKLTLHSLNIIFPRDDILILWDYNGMIIISFDKSIQIKKRRKESSAMWNISQLDSGHIRFVETYNSLLGVEIIDNKEMLIVRRPWKEIEDKLPPSLYRIRYGT